MAEIRPFGGLRYDLARAGDAASLMAPPYDVIDDEGRAELAARSPHNAIHFVLPEGEGDAKYPAGAARFREQVASAMVRDQAPGIYLYHQRFSVEGQTYVRKGLICLIELTRFGQGPVLAHERTLAGPKADRLNLMRACQAHLELVFGMFSDPDRAWEGMVDPHRGQPVLHASFDEVEHTLWRVHDPSALAALQDHLRPRSIYIADGHHRYETMCAFRDELRAAGNPNADFGMIYLSNLDDPGLVVLPTHRLVHGLPAVDLDGVLRASARWFSHREVALPGDAGALRQALATDGPATFGLTQPRSGSGSGTLHVLRLRDDFDPIGAGLSELPPALQRLDVALLHELVLERALGITKAAQEAKTNLYYYKSTTRTLEVAAGRGATAAEQGVQLLCLMNAPPVSDVRAVCDSGHVMPQKSTFFHPKIPNGLVFHDLRPLPR
ncbi:DUF1015 domain-containing protein [Paraliomyxa miuraensis]|uniref:DUF1015 domain-containing protein n=1 Tax=Paraliomyxa miuraensis TaxID=376150 RepID=UPI0022557367|nr:DUF1015 domain-containing protein [Paraliomyxa miuraensis]MCX4242349.1 DUF1015 domain-containing protein [Paraliomyxa miuraensis]